MIQNVLYPNQTAAPQPQMYFCFKCRWEGRTFQKICPRCGKSLFSQTNVRIRGVMLAFIGLFLSGFMSVIAFFGTVFLMEAAKNPKTGAKFNGDESMLVLTYLIFGGVIAMGITAFIAGLWQIIFG